MTAIGGTANRPFGARLERPFARARGAPIGLRRPTLGALLAGAALGLYLAVAVLLVFVMHSVEGDAWSRVGNAYYMLYSRDPHLAAIGFVWNPLPSLAVLPLLPLKDLWPPLVGQGFAANIVSALCMAGAVYQVRAILLQLSVRRVTAAGLTVLFAVHPMVVLFGANGMSEAMFVLFSLVAVRHLMKWSATRQSAALVHGGIALGLLYLTRYEGAAVAAGAIAFVLVHSYLRVSGGIRERAAVAAADVLIVTTPFVFAVGLFALTSWIIVGSPFETFTSVYGSSSQLSLSISDIQKVTGQGTAAAPGYLVRQVGGLEPAGGLAIAAAVVALLRRRPEALVPAVLLGAGIAFSVWTFAIGKSFGWLRFYILVVPLVTLAAGALLAWRRSVPTGQRIAAALSGLTGVAVLALVGLGLPSGLLAMSDARLGREETDKVSWFVGSRGPWSDATRIRQAQQFAALDVAGYLDRLNLAPGSVLIDVATGFPVVLQSVHPQQFVITSDRDFGAAAADPIAFGVRYVVVAPALGYETVNAIERLHPGMYDTGAGIAELADEFGAGPGSWRLYRIRGEP